MGFVLAAAGSAVGLGNIWKFPYITGENGGGAFVLVYLLCVSLVGLPVMVAEILIGRSTQSSPVRAFRILAGERSSWLSMGWLGVASAFVILSYYKHCGRLVVALHILVADGQLGQSRSGGV